MSEEAPPFNVFKLPMRVNPTVFPTDTQNMSSTRSGTAAAQQRPSTAGRPSSAQAQRNTVDFARQQSQQAQQVEQLPAQSVSSTAPVDHRATGAALERPVIFDGRPVEAILNELDEHEKQVNALRHRFRSIIRRVEDLNFENSKFSMSYGFSVYAEEIRSWRGRIDPSCSKGER